MKRRVLSFLAGAAAALALTALTATALAASGQVQFNFAGVALNGETKIAAGSDITAPNGQRVPGSILYVDEAGGKTNYLPIRTISELLGVKVGYDSATRTVLLGEQTAPASAAVASGLYWHRETDEDGVTYASEDPGIDYTEAPGYALTKLPEGWGLESVRAGMGGRGNLSYRNGSGGRISFSCAYPDGGSYGWSPGSGEIPCRTVTVNGHDAALYTYSSEYGDSCLLVWEDEAGVLFWFTGSDVDPDTLVEAASSVEPTSKTAPACEADWLPGGYSWFETNASGGAAETTWVGQGGNITLTCSATPLAGGDNLEPRMRKPCAATISIFRVLSLHMFLQLFVLALNRFEAICQGRIDIGLTSQYHLQIVLCPLELILILLSSLFVCRNTFPVGWHPHQPK